MCIAQAKFGIHSVHWLWLILWQDGLKSY
jgi:hypothetical protein